MNGPPTTGDGGSKSSGDLVCANSSLRRLPLSRHRLSGLPGGTPVPDPNVYLTKAERRSRSFAPCCRCLAVARCEVWPGQGGTIALAGWGDAGPAVAEWDAVVVVGVRLRVGRR